MADLFGALVTNNIARENQERAYQQTRELQAETQAYNERLWHLSNAYNSPIAQMQRFKSAGLNPNLIYGQMSQGAAAPSMSAGSAPSPANVADTNLLETAQLGLLTAQKRNIDADTEQKKASVGETYAHEKLLSTQEFVEKENLRLQQTLNDSQIQLNDEQKRVLREQGDKLIAETNEINVRSAIANIERRYLDATYDDRVQLVKEQLKETISRANLNNAQINRINKLLEQELSNLQEEFRKLEADTQLTQQQKSNLAQQKMVEAADNFYLLTAQDLKRNGNWFDRTFTTVGFEIVHLFTHGLGLGRILR